MVLVPKEIDAHVGRQEGSKFGRGPFPVSEKTGDGSLPKRGYPKISKTSHTQMDQVQWSHKGVCLCVRNSASAFPGSVAFSARLSMANKSGTLTPCLFGCGSKRYQFGVGAPPILVYSGDWDIHWGCDLAFEKSLYSGVHSPVLTHAIR